MIRAVGHQVKWRGSGFRQVSSHPAFKALEAELVLKPKDPERAIEQVIAHGPYSVAEFHRRHGPPPEVTADFIRYLSRRGLEVRQEGLSLLLRGSLRQYAETFNVSFFVQDNKKARRYVLARDPEFPESLHPWVAGVVGLENLSRARPFLRTPGQKDQAPNQGQGYWPADILNAYRFPPNLDGSGVTVGILEFSNGYNPEDLAAFWAMADVTDPKLTFVSVDGTPNDNGQNPWDAEATLDVEWVGALAPGAQIIVFEAAAGFTDAAFGLSLLKALRAALHASQNRPQILSISYGDGETRFPKATMEAWSALFFEGAMTGVTTLVASGDSGAYGLQEIGRPVPHVDAPANCPWVVAVGGTHLDLGAGDTRAQETGWTDTNNNGASGGGISQVFMVPPYQSGLHLPLKPGMRAGRGVPDVAANADPDSGYAIVFQGQIGPVGGTSVAAPVWAALLARITQGRFLRGLPALGYLHPSLYTASAEKALHDILVGNNNYFGVEGYQCGPGWDAVTGWGTPDGQALYAYLVGVPPYQNASAPPPSPATTPAEAEPPATATAQAPEQSLPG